MHMHPREWNPEGRKILTELAEENISHEVRKQRLISFIRGQKPINHHIRHEIPAIMKGFWNDAFIQQFLEQFGNGAPAPKGFQDMVENGTDNWT